MHTHSYTYTLVYTHTHTHTHLYIRAHTSVIIKLINRKYCKAEGRSYTVQKFKAQSQVNRFSVFTWTTCRWEWQKFYMKQFTWSKTLRCRYRLQGQSTVIKRVNYVNVRISVPFLKNHVGDDPEDLRKNSNNYVVLTPHRRTLIGTERKYTRRSRYCYSVTCTYHLFDLQFVIGTWRRPWRLE